MAPNDRELGRLEAQVEEMQHEISEMQDRVGEIQSDMHELKVMVSQLETKLDLLTKQQDWRITIFGYGLFAAAGFGLYIDKLTPLYAVILVLIAAVVLQKESINKLARTFFRVGDNSSTEATPTS